MDKLPGFRRERRRFVATTAGALVAGALAPGCAHRGEPERIIDAQGRAVPREDLIVALRRADFVLLGELHDNPRHHELRADLLAVLGRDTAVVAEHLNAGASLQPGGDLRQRLEAAGFDARGWSWPMHEPLFAAARREGLRVSGGNLPREDARRIAREGLPAVEPRLRHWLDAAPLSATGQAAIDQDLIDGHCGHLQPERLPLLRTAQRTRDASMALALVASGGAPAVLLAGNGHVRRDYGVPTFLSVLRPQARVVVVGFVERAESAIDADYLWITAPAVRKDPCEGLRMSAPAQAPKS